ncbi:hypothetical protein NDN08_000090 [Rhodosorus marinus]|uniref:Probable ATP-dependent transporter ycf16 n=1 Tax=Rhodosorus marinus TaxID=101924 RepID=A0AAV8UE68_9RHOD|nr:hypothetical protein NDN08_000090 [Rhodosorus marinus]
MSGTEVEVAELGDSKHLPTVKTSYDSDEEDEEVIFEDPEAKLLEDEEVEYEEVKVCFGLFTRKRKKVEKPPAVSLAKLFTYSNRRERLFILIGIFAGACQGALLPMFTIIFGNILEDFGSEESLDNPDEALESIRNNALIFVYLGLGALVAGVCQVYFMMWTSQQQARRMRNLYMRSLLSQEMGWYDEVDSAELAQRVSGDIQKVEDGIGDKVSTAAQFMTMFLVGFIIGFVYGWQLTLVILAVTPLLAASGYLFAKMSADAVGEGQTAYAKAGAIAHESFSMIKIVASYGLEASEIERYGEALKAAISSGIRKSFWMGLGMGLTMFVILCSYGLAFWYGNKLVRDEVMSAADVVTVFFSVIIGAMALGQGAPAMNAITEARGAAPRVFEVIERQSKIDAFGVEGKAGMEVQGNIELKDVMFTYHSRPDRLVLNGLNLTIEAGTTVALVGESGCGKSTTMQLLERFYDPKGGSVTLDGVELSEMNVQWLRGQIGLVSQMPTLFAMSIRDNIGLGGRIDVVDTEEGREVRRMEPSLEEVIAAAKLANAHEFISKLPEGYDTVIGDRGAQLSGGQKQRVAIARALVRNPKILLLDEATSALDTASERVVQEAIDKAQEGRTVVLIAHRLSTIKNADKIAVFENGAVKELGTHDELFAKEHGIYSNLVKLQQIADDEEDEGGELDQSKFSTSRRATQKSETEGKSVHKTTKSATGLSETDLETEAQAEKVVDKGVVTRALALNEPEWPYFVGGIVGACISGVIWPIFSLLMSEMLVVLVETNDQAEARFWSLIFVLVGFVSLWSNLAQLFFFGLTGERLTNRLRKMTFKAIIRQDVGFFDMRENSVGILTTRLGAEAAKVKGATGERLGNFVMMGATMVSAIAIAFSACWALALVVLLTVPLFAIGGMIQMKMMGGLSGELGKLFANANAIATNTVDSIQTVTSLGVGEKFLADYDHELEIPAQTGKRKALITGSAFGFTQFCMFGIWGLSFWFGSLLISWEWCDFAGMLKALTALLFGAMTLGQVAALMPDAADAGYAATRVFRLIDKESPIDPFDESGEVMEKCQGEVELKNVSFRYPARPEMTVLKGLQVKAEKGKMLALVGPSGSGKSTVVTLAERFYDPYSGTVKIDGEPLKHWNLASMRDHIGFVTQEPELFSTTVRENIAHGMRKAEGSVATEEDIVNAAKLANAHKFVMKLPKGYDTQVGAHGGQLSGGQRQRIAIARAVVRNPKILLLDEATSALDSESEKIVQKALDKAASGRTTIVIAHRLSTIQHADTIAVVSDGKIVEKGTHHELMTSHGGVYSSLVKQQQL